MSEATALSKFQIVSILTGPEGPVQQTRRARLRKASIAVSILTGPEGPVQPDRAGRVQERCYVSILTGPEGPVQPRGRGRARLAAEQVSILTGPEGPVQRPQRRPRDGRRRVSFNPHRTRRPGATITGAIAHGIDPVVSILTGPEGPVQPTPFPYSLRARCSWFQSSPDPKARCNAVEAGEQVVYIQFQSSPDPKARCNDWTKTLKEKWGPLRFNPHRTRRPGATFLLYAVPFLDDEFQSSPDPKARCNGIAYFSHSTGVQRIVSANPVFVTLAVAQFAIALGRILACSALSSIIANALAILFPLAVRAS